MKAFGVMLVAAALGAHLAHVRWERVETPAPRSVAETFPSAEALRLMSLGYPTLVADYYWLRAISNFGTTEMNAAGYPNLNPLVERVLALDPYFAAAYRFAGTALTVNGMDLAVPERLLLQGMRYRSDVWQIPFYLGFNSYYFGHDYRLAAWAMAEAAKVPGAPEIAGALATRLSAQAGEPEVGLRLVDTMLETVDDPQLVKMYMERRKLLELELELRVLNQAAARFAVREGRPPRRLSELVGPGLLRSVPDNDPLGGRYTLGADGAVHTTSEARRLRLNAAAAGGGGER